jgi:type IV secretory pathway component VirB8
MISNYSPQNDFPNNDDWDYIFKLMILISILITLLAFALIFLTPEIFNYLINL